MKQLRKTAVFTVISILMIFSFSFIPTSTYAAKSTDVCKQDVPQEVKEANGCPNTSSPDLNNVVVNIIDGLISALAVAVAIMIVVGGVGYLTSGGDVNKIEKAKKTLTYAVIGAIICALAFAITNLVIGALKSA